MADISAYVDGELAPAEELSLEAHIAGCGFCAAELNLHKQFLNELDNALDGGDAIELPRDFTKAIVTAAESDVGGVRRRREVVTALTICAVALVAVLCIAAASGTGGESGESVFLDKAVTIAAAGGHLVYSLALGFAVLIRAASAGAGPALLPAAAAAVFAAVLGWFAYLRMRRSGGS